MKNNELDDWLKDWQRWMDKGKWIPYNKTIIIIITDLDCPLLEENIFWHGLPVSAIHSLLHFEFSKNVFPFQGY
jgi:hypothetical protein